jgi:hypothetical protein
MPLDPTLTEQLPEAREMLSLTERYVADDVDFMELYHAIQMCAHWARERQLGEPVLQLCREWFSQADRCRNEMGMAKDPLTDDEFKAWLRRQLAAR